MMVAVDFDLKFTYVLAGWEGSAHDALILADALERNDGFVVPAGISEQFLVAFDRFITTGSNTTHDLLFVRKILPRGCGLCRAARVSSTI